MRECPYCHSKKGVYTKHNYRVHQRYDFNSQPCGYEEYETWQSARIYCINCDRSLGHVHMLSEWAKEEVDE